MSEAFEILSAALDEAIRDAKSNEPFLKRETLSINVDESKKVSCDDNEKTKYQHWEVQSAL